MRYATLSKSLDTIYTFHLCILHIIYRYAFKHFGQGSSKRQKLDMLKCRSTKFVCDMFIFYMLFVIAYNKKYI